MGPTQTQLTRRAERMLLIHPCRYEMTESHEGAPVMLHEGCALSVNVSDHGMLLLLPQPAQVHQIFEVLAPALAGGPPALHVVEVRWTKPLVTEEEGTLWMAGVKVLAAPSRLEPTGSFS